MIVRNGIVPEKWQKPYLRYVPHSPMVRQAVSSLSAVSVGGICRHGFVVCRHRFVHGEFSLHLVWTFIQAL